MYRGNYPDLELVPHVVLGHHEVWGRKTSVLVTLVAARGYENEQGSFGEVYLAKWRSCHVAVKRIKLPVVRVARRSDRRAWLKQLGLGDEARRGSDSGSHSSFSDDDEDEVDELALLEEQHRKLAEAFVRELTLLRRLRHQRVVLFMAACVAPRDLCLLTEYLPRGSLHALLHRRRKRPQGRRLLQMARDVADGVAFLHAHNVVHRDLKPSNLLLDDDYRVKVSEGGRALLPGAGRDVFRPP